MTNLSINLSGRKIISSVRICWSWCRAYLGEEQFYAAYDWRFWNSFNNFAQRYYHLWKIQSILGRIPNP